MGLAVWVGKKRYEVGAAAFLKAVFSTIYARLEDEGWGERYPVFMNDFYSGHVSPAMAELALEEVAEIARGFELLRVSEVVWDFEHREKAPPWIHDDDYDPARSAREYFLTSDGKDLFDVLADAFTDSLREKRDASIS